MRDDIRLLQQKTGITSIYVTHDQAEALSVSDEVIVMNNGAIEQQGAPRDLYRKPKSAFVANFIGESNVVEAILEVHGATATISLGETTLDLDAGEVDNKPGSVKLSLRPEMFRLSEAGDPAQNLPGNIVHSSYMGPVTEYLIPTPVGELFTTAPAGDQHDTTGSIVYLHLNPDELIILPDES